MTSLLDSLRRLSDMSPASRSFLARAWLTVPVIELSLALAGVPGTLRWIEALPRARGEREPTSIDEGGRLVRAACRRHPLAGECLSQATLQYLLHRRDGLPARLVIGVKREAAKLDAHAWVEPPAQSPAGAGSEFAPILTRSFPEARA